LPSFDFPDAGVREVLEQGIRVGIDLRIEIGPSAYASGEIVDRYYNPVLNAAVESIV
jgi:hypothetical protein